MVGPMLGPKYLTQPLPAPLRGLWDLRDPFSPLRQRGAAQEGCLALLSDLALLPSVLGGGRPHAGVGQPARRSPSEPQVEREKPTQPQGSPWPVSHVPHRQGNRSS